MKAIVPIVALLAACDQSATLPAANEVNQAAPQSAAKPTGRASKAFIFDEKNDLIEFHYAWSAEAAAVPQLVNRFRKEMDQVRATSAEDARESKANEDELGFEFHRHMYSADYETAGKSERLLSLKFDFSADTGGAHGHYGTGALLWDRPAGKEIKVLDLFAEASKIDQLLTQRWCDALKKEREEKRGAPVVGDEMSDKCPSLSEIAIIPADRDKDRRFEALMLVASPYVAGPWVEGSYDIELGVAPELIAALKPDFRESFEAQAQ